MTPPPPPNFKVLILNMLRTHTASLDLVLPAEVTADNQLLGSLGPQLPVAYNLWKQRGKSPIPSFWQYMDCQLDFFSSSF